MVEKNKTKIKLKTRIIISFFGFFLIVLSIIFFIVIPSVKDIVSIKNNIEEQRNELERRYIKGQGLRDLSEKIESVEERIDDINNIFVDKSKGLEFITALENLADSKNVNQKIDISLDNGEIVNEFEKIPIRLYTQGTFNNQMDYLLGLELMDYYININLIEINPYAPVEKSGEENENYISLLLLADTFWQN
jgi:ABC-type antimicrobial peptide transport system permease subunit